MDTFFFCFVLFEIHIKNWREGENHKRKKKKREKAAAQYSDALVQNFLLLFGGVSSR
jgi:ABC-type transport system involved in Fe-S cluster assembly fused permease/ATPase subunit